MLPPPVIAGFDPQPTLHSSLQNSYLSPRHCGLDPQPTLHSNASSPVIAGFDPHPLFILPSSLPPVIAGLTRNPLHSSFSTLHSLISVKISKIRQIHVSPNRKSKIKKKSKIQKKTLSLRQNITI